MAKMNITLFDDFNIDFDSYKAWFQECRELSNEDMEEIEDDEIYDFISECVSDEWHDLFVNLKFSEFSNIPCVITGTLGLWNGRPTIVPVACDDISSAIKKCARDMDYTIVKQVNGHIEVQGIHHDGTNCFEIHFLNEKGISAMERIESGCGNAKLNCHCYHKAMKDFIF